MEKARDLKLTLRPAFEKNNIAVAFAANDAFAPYTAAMIYSIIANGNMSNNYDFVVLQSEIGPESQSKFHEMTEPFENVSLRFVDVTEHIAGYAFYVGNKENFTKEAYFRLLIPEVMAEYQKVLYLDGDMIALTDVAELYQTELDVDLLASSRDFCGIIDYYNPFLDLRKYRDETLRLKKPDDYFIDGMVLFNIPAFRKAYSTKELLEFAASKEWRQHDQDVLNVLCEGRTKLVSAAWDVMVPELTGNLPEELRKELEESIANARIIHFGGKMKPWLYMDAPFGEHFWRYAAQTPFIQEILCRRLELDRGVYSARVEMEREFRQGKAGARYILKYIRAWLAYKVKRDFGR